MSDDAINDDGVAVGVRVRVHPGTEHESRGVVVDDYGENPMTPIDLGPDRVIAPARRWAVTLDDGSLMFADGHEVRMEHEDG